jgi:hypothetical protein
MTGERLADAWHAGQQAVLNLTRPCSRFSRISIHDRSVTVTAILVLIAKPTSAASGILSFVALPRRLIWLPVIRSHVGEMEVGADLLQPVD